MSLPSSTLGIDISQARLDAFAHPTQARRSFPNTDAGVAALTAWATELEAFTVLEATAPHDRRLLRALEGAGAAFHRANPRKAREFARAAGFMAKTDKVDARMLAAYGAALPLGPTRPVTPARLELQELVARREELVEMRKAERIRLKGDPGDWLHHSLLELIAVLDQQIRTVEGRIRACVAASQALCTQDHILRSAPGVGPTVAAVLLAWMPELGQINRRAIASLAGLAPIACESGAWRGQRHIWGGRKRVRDALYMAALSARRDKAFSADYAALVERGKPPKAAIIAIARKLLVALNAKIREGKPFKTSPA